MGEKYFDSERDARIIKEGGFFCMGCLVGKPADTQSTEDPRYCKKCYIVIRDYKKWARNSDKGE